MKNILVQDCVFVFFSTRLRSVVHGTLLYWRFIIVKWYKRAKSHKKNDILTVLSIWVNAQCDSSLALKPYEYLTNDHPFELALRTDIFPSDLKIVSQYRIRQWVSFCRNNRVSVCQKTHPGLELQPLTYLTAESSSLTGTHTKAGNHL